MAEWMCDSGVKIGGIKSNNDGDVCISFITHEVLQKAKKPPICFDIGADKGWWTAFCLHYSPTSFVYTFEPNPISYRGILETISGDRMKLYNSAVSNTNSFIFLTLDGPTSNSRSDASGAVVEIPCVSITHHLEKHGFVDIIKIDTEGHEPEILFDIEPHWKSIGVIIFEFTVWWYTKRVATELMKKCIDAFQYVYAVSRKGPPILFGPIHHENCFEFLRFIGANKVQADIVVSHTPLTTIPIEQAWPTA